MGFTNDYSKATEIGSLKPKGDYEVVIAGIEEKTNRNGKTCLNFSLVIRNDVPEQKYANAYLFYPLWKRKEPGELDMQVGGYGFGQLMALGKASQLPDGKNYETLNDYCKDLYRKCIRVTVDHKMYEGKNREEIIGIAATKYPDCKHSFKAKGAAQTQPAPAPQPVALGGGFQELSDDDCPF